MKTASLLWLLLLTIATSATGLAQDSKADLGKSPSASAAEGSKLSRDALAADLQAAKSKLLALNEQEAAIQKFETVLRDAQIDIKAVPVPALLSDALAAMKKSVATLAAELAKTPPTPALARGANAIPSAIFNLQNNLGFSSLHESAQRIFNLPSPLRTVIDLPPMNFASNPLPTSFPALVALQSTIQASGGSYDAATLAPVVEDARKELDATNPEKLKEAFDSSKAPLTDYAEKIQKLLGPELTARKDAKTAVITQIDQLNKELVKREDSLRGIATTVSGYILWVVILMVVAVIAALLILRLFHPTLTQMLIRERTVVEMSSISLFLVTVLFLGTGDFIEKPALGALFGTLAGYLFTRRSSRGGDGSASEEDASTPALPAAPKAPKIDLLSKRATVAKMPTNAVQIKIFATDPAGQVSALGSALGAVVPVDLSALKSGASYALFAVAANSMGDSPASPSTTFSLP